MWSQFNIILQGTYLYYNTATWKIFIYKSIVNTYSNNTKNRVPFVEHNI